MSFAHKRLRRDYREIEMYGKQNYVYVKPLKDNILEWHGNLVPQQGRYQGIMLHCVLTFPEDYPTNPPKIRLGTGIPHSNIIEYNGDPNYLCLDLIKNFFWMQGGYDQSKPYVGWSSAYSVLGIMMQLQAFLFDDIVEHYDDEYIHSFYELAPEEGGGTRDLAKAKQQLDNAFTDAKEFTCDTCGHCWDTPSPAISITIPERNPVVIRPNLKTPDKWNDRFYLIIRGWWWNYLNGGYDGKIREGSDADITSFLKECRWNVYIGMRKPIITDRIRFVTTTYNARNLGKFIDIDGNGPFWQYHHGNKSCSCQPCKDLRAIEEEFKHMVFTDKVEGEEEEVSDKHSLQVLLDKMAKSYSKHNELKIWMELYKDGYGDNLKLRPKNSVVIAVPKRKTNIKQQFDIKYFDKMPVDAINVILEYLLPEDRMTFGNCANNLSSIVNSPYFQEKQRLMCYYTKQSYTECILGYGIGISFYKSGAVKEVHTPLDTICSEAFYEFKVRKAVWNEMFTMFLPIYIDTDHISRCKELLLKCITSIYYGMNYSPEDINTSEKNDDLVKEMLIRQYANKKFKPHQALEVLTKLMSSMGVHMMKGNTYISTKALEAFSQFHRLLLWFVQEYPQIQTIADDRLTQFINSERSRRKDITPSLGELLPLLTISKKYNWLSISDAYLEESLTRNARWTLKRCPELAWVDGELSEFDEDRVTKSFGEGIGKKLTIFTIYFCQNIAKPEGLSFEQIVRRYDEMYGMPTRDIKDGLQKFLKKVEKISTWEEYFKHIDVYCPPTKLLAEKLRLGVLRSEKLKYHSRKELHITNDQYNKERYGRTGWIGNVGGWSKHKTYSLNHQEADSWR